ncbi:hypothetical protein QE152_g6999 [Popillia japonica]|uniref:Uncharacterized protein n=1 Tax=Popillia japonica TaxID=7064 RepID=A0AAW1MI93_POPJA
MSILRYGTLVEITVKEAILSPTINTYVDVINDNVASNSYRGNNENTTIETLGENCNLSTEFQAQATVTNNASSVDTSSGDEHLSGTR